MAALLLLAMLSSVHVARGQPRPSPPAPAQMTWHIGKGRCHQVETRTGGSYNYDYKDDLTIIMKGCHVIGSEEKCINSKDGRDQWYGQPCAWCCGDDCRVDGDDVGEKCQPMEWLMQHKAYVGHHRTGLGHNNCPAEGEAGIVSKADEKRALCVRSCTQQFGWENEFLGQDEYAYYGDYEQEADYERPSAWSPPPQAYGDDMPPFMDDYPVFLAAIGYNEKTGVCECNERCECIDDDDDWSLATFEPGTNTQCWDEEVDWYEASKICTEEFQGSLVTVASAAQEGALLRKAPLTPDKYREGGCIWAGMNDIAREGIWQWASGYLPTSAASNYSNWSEGEPNDIKNQDCLKVCDYGWNDRSCNWERNNFCCDVGLVAAPRACTRDETREQNICEVFGAALWQEAGQGAKPRAPKFDPDRIAYSAPQWVLEHQPRSRGGYQAGTCGYVSDMLDEGFLKCCCGDHPEQDCEDRRQGERGGDQYYDDEEWEEWQEMMEEARYQQDDAEEAGSDWASSSSTGSMPWRGSDAVDIDEVYSDFADGYYDWSEEEWQSDESICDMTGEGGRVVEDRRAYKPDPGEGPWAVDGHKPGTCGYANFNKELKWAKCCCSDPKYCCPQGEGTRDCLIAQDRDDNERWLEPLYESGKLKVGRGNHSTVGWTKAVVLKERGRAVAVDVGRDRFNALFEACPVVRYIRDAVVHSVYVRTSPVPEWFNAYGVFTDTWASMGNTMHEDFELFSSWHDAQLRRHPWTFCNYDDPDVGYPRDCGPTSAVEDLWFSMPGFRYDSRHVHKGLGFEIYSGHNCPAKKEKHIDEAAIGEHYGVIIAAVSGVATLVVIGIVVAVVMVVRRRRAQQPGCSSPGIAGFQELSDDPF